MTRKTLGTIGGVVFMVYVTLIIIVLFSDAHWGIVGFVILMGAITTYQVTSIGWSKGAIETYNKINQERRTHAI